MVPKSAATTPRCFPTGGGGILTPGCLPSPLGMPLQQYLYNTEPYPCPLAEPRSLPRSEHPLSLCLSISPRAAQFPRGLTSTAMKDGVAGWTMKVKDLLGTNIRIGTLILRFRGGSSPLCRGRGRGGGG